MISRWNVLKYVADRYGKIAPVFDLAERKVELMREGKIQLLSLEENPERVQNRLARERVEGFGLERIVGLPNFLDKNVLDKLSTLAKSVCRLLKNGSPIGTGFLVAPEILMTNHHVIGQAQDAHDMLAEFDFELDVAQRPKQTVHFKLNPIKFFLTSSLAVDQDIPNSGLDFTLVGVESTALNGASLQPFGAITLDGNLGKIIKGEACVVIQHPNGDPKKVVLKDNIFFAETRTKLIYEADTLPGSSGAAVIGLGTCQLIGLHHSGYPRTDNQNRILTKTGKVADASTPDHEIDWLGNQGVKVSCIVKAIQEANLPASMEPMRSMLLRDTNRMAAQLSQHKTPASEANAPPPKPPTNITTNRMDTVADVNPATTNAGIDTKDFIITTRYLPDNIVQIESVLSARYQVPVSLELITPGSARRGDMELFSLSVPFNGNLHEEAHSLTRIPGIEFAEPDIPLRINADPSLTRVRGGDPGVESALISDGLFEWNESAFKEAYEDSDYVKGKQPAEYRRWNWAATKFDRVLQSIPSPTEAGIRIVQLDTGYSNHTKVAGGFDLEADFNFVENHNDSLDPQTVGILKFPGHGTRTASVIIGKENAFIQHEGNAGLLSSFDFKLVPYRIAETVVIINRQKQLAAALDLALTQGYDIITMSMGLPPTLTTSRLAKKAYDMGVIWCCAAGNEVRTVVAPAVFPGTIAVAASNPKDKEWEGSSRGDRVDITAPGQDVYVPVWNQRREEDFCFGSGTSYATPHIAAAAAAWLAAHQKALSSSDYRGWRRVEAFRRALKDSAQKRRNLPSGFGAGILDMEKLLATPPRVPRDRDYAYNKWNEHAFLDCLQGWGEVVKAYWNSLHGWITGGRKEESLMLESLELSPFAKQLERSLFAYGNRPLESRVQPGTLLERYQVLQKNLETSATKDL